jgi:N-acetylglucosamine kinase-like BadF-type ATPase
VQAVAKAWSQRGPATRLSDTFVAAAGATDVTDLLAGLMRERYFLGAESAHLVFEAASERDQVALELVRRAGHELGKLAIGVWHQIGKPTVPFDVVLSGSLYNGSPLIQSVMAETIHAAMPQARLVRLEAPPVVGAVLLGMEQVGLQPAALRETLISSTNRLLETVKLGDLRKP